MRRHRTRFITLFCLGFALGAGALPRARAQGVPLANTRRIAPVQFQVQVQAPGVSVEVPAPGTVSEPQRADLVLLKALAANPITAPYQFSVGLAGGKVVLAGRVGTKRIHDVAIQTATALNINVQDELIIDTAAVVVPGPAPGVGAAGAAGPAVPMSGGVYGIGRSYVYPPPLLGYYGDPFFGFEPPLITYPPWWQAMSLYRLRKYAGLGVPMPGLAPGPGGVPGGLAGSSVTTIGPAAPAPAIGQPQDQQAPEAEAPADGVEMSLDSRGVAVLRGTVPTLADRIAVGQQIAATPGVTEVINLLNVRQVAGASAPQPAAPAPEENGAAPPPPHVPAVAAENENDDEQDPAAIRLDGGGFEGRLAQSLARRPALADLPIRATERNGVVQLSGQVPTVYEAMLAYRAIEQTPGVREIVDRLQFQVPDGRERNPLLVKGRPEDVEPYLEAQIRRQVGDAAHIDRVRLQGDTLEVRGSLAQPDDLARVEGILRSMPILRDFQIDPQFSAE